MIIYPADVVLFEGILVFYFPAIRDLFHMKLFVDTDSDTRLSRRGEEVDSWHQQQQKPNANNKNLLLISVVRDISERGRDLEQILNQYMTFVKPAFEEFCSPVSRKRHVVKQRAATAVYEIREPN